MRKFLPVLAALAGVTALAAPANAGINLSSVQGPWTNPGFTPSAFFDFEGDTSRFTGGLVASNSVSGVRAQPWQSTGNYATVSPSDGTPGYFDLTGLGPIGKISLLWGSIDNYNDLDVLDALGNVIASFNGAMVIADANGAQSDPLMNRLVTLTLTGDSTTEAAKLRFRSTGNAFEFDNVAVQSVPEASTWAMMIVGLGAIGFAMRRKQNVAVSFA